MRRRSIAPTYDSRDTGPRFHVTTTVRDRVVSWQSPVPDPFVRVVVRVGLWDMLRAFVPTLFRRGRLAVQITVGADPEMINDVLELDSNTLLPNSTRQAEHQQYLADLAALQFGDPNPRYEPEEGQPL